MKKRFLGLVITAALSVSMLAGCGSNGTVAKLEDPNEYPKETYEIQWYLPIENTPSDLESVEAELNKYLKEKINATVNINCMASGQYKEKLGMMINTGEYFDMCFVATWMLDYVNNARKNVFFDLTDHLDTYLKDATEAIGKENLQLQRVDGRLKALPVYKEMASQYGWIYRKDMADKYGIDMSQYKTFEEFMPVAEMLKEKEKSIEYVVDWSNLGTPYNMYNIIYNIDPSGTFEPDKVINFYKTDEFKQAIAIAREYYQKGLVRPDVLTATDDVAKMASGKTFAMYNLVKPGKAAEMFPDSQYDFAEVGTANIYLDHMAGAQSMQAISATSKNPARVMKFMNLLNSDPYVKNLVIHGIEGKHYEKIDDKTIKQIPNSGYSLYDNTWAIGNVFLDYLKDDENPDKLEILKTLNKNAIHAPVQGYVPSEMDSEIKQIELDCNAAVDKYRKQLITGAVDTEPTYSEFISTLDKCDYDKYLEWIQKDYDEYLKTVEDK